MGHISRVLIYFPCFQSTHMAHEVVDEDSVYTCVGHPLRRDIENIVNWVLNENFTTAYNSILLKKMSTSAPLVAYKISITHYQGSALFLCRLRSIGAHRDHFVRRLSVRPSVCLSGSHTFLVFTHSYVWQWTHAFL